METIEESLQRLRQEIKSKTKTIKPGKARNATTNGGICAAQYGASGLGRGQASAQAYREWKESKALKKKKQAKYIASPEQRKYAKDLGFPLKKNCSKKKAIKLIDAAVRIKGKKSDKFMTNKERRQAIRLELELKNVCDK